MKKISKLLKSLALSIVSLCMVFGIVFNVKGEEARRVNADTTSKVYSTDYYTLSYADNEVKLLLSTSLLEYQDLLSKEDLADLKNAIVSVGYSAIFDDLDFSTTFKSPKARKRLAAQSANGQGIDITLITDLILDQLSKGSELETEQAISNALSSEGTYDTVLEFYVDRYVEKYANGDEAKAQEAYSEITEDLCDALQTAVNNADLGAHFTPDIIQDKVQTIVDNAALEGQVDLSLGQVTDVVNLLEDKTVVADVIKELEIQSYVVDVVKDATPEETTNFLIQVETQTIIEVFNTVEISKDEVKEVITNVGVDKLIEVLDKKGMDDIKELAGAVGLTKEDIQDTVYDNLSNISINTLLSSFRSIQVNGHALYEDGEIKEQGFVALLKTLPKPSEIANYTDDQIRALTEFQEKYFESVIVR